MQLCIHHFFDIIRDFGAAKDIDQHPYGHAYHRVARIIRDDPDIPITLVSGPDDVCMGCRRLMNGRCEDTIGHRTDFRYKDAFNRHLEKRIMEKCGLRPGDRLNPRQLCRQAKDYLDHIFWIYEGNDALHTQVRKENVIKGLAYYQERHGS